MVKPIAGVMNTVRRIVRKAGRIASATATVRANAAHYSVGFACYSAMSRFLDFRRKPNRLTYFIMARRRYSILEYLRKKYERIIDEYQLSGECVQETNENGRIWVFWWQGEHDAPSLVQKCIASIRRHSGAHGVFVLSKENFADFVTMPRRILEMHDDGRVTHNQFANLLRVMLLEQCGGAWLDATVYASGPIDESVFTHPFYTHKIEHREPGRFDYTKWSTYFLAGGKRNTLFRFVRDCYLLHWIDDERQVDYFLFDYTIWLAYETVPSVKAMIDSVPYNNPCILSLQQVLGNKFDETLFQQYTRDTYLHKLTWKTQFDALTSDNERTFYGHLLEPNGSAVVTRPPQTGAEAWMSPS